MRSSPRTVLALLAPLGFVGLLGCPTEPADDGGFTFSTTLPGTTDNGDGDGDEAGTMDAGDGDGDAGDGDGDTGPGSCGDGVVDEGEQCDLGEQNSDSGQCTTSCNIAVSGSP